MNEKKINIQKQNDTNLSNTNDELNKAEEFKIPSEAACSPEFAEGCFILEDDELEEK